AAGAASRLLASDFRGGRLLTDDDTRATGDVAFYVKRTTAAGADSARSPSSSPPSSSSPSTSPSQSPALTLDARAFGAGIQRLVADMREVTVTEFQITSIDAGQASPTSQPASQPSQPASQPSRPASLPSQPIRTDVRYDIVGIGTTAWRVERNGTWRMSWRK